MPDGVARLRRPGILVLDDEEPIRRMLERVLTDAGYACVAVGDLAAARDAMVTCEIDLLLCDITLAGESGLDLVRQINRDLLDVAIVMVTGIDDPVVAGVAITLGASGYLVKPFSANEILIQVDSALRRRELERVRRFHVEELESKVLERSSSLHSVIGQLAEGERERMGAAHRETADRLTAALSLRDEETGQHIERVGRSAVLLARAAGVAEWPDEDLQIAAMLHDVGKIAVPDLVLLKPGPLSDSEQASMRRHPEAGHRLLDGASARVLRLGASVALTHHERWDGTGYPVGLAGEAIPLAGRITGVADAFDAMTSDRVYRPAMSVEQALDLMRGQRGKQFDPGLLDAFLGIVDDVVALRAELADEEEMAGNDAQLVKVLVVDDHTMFAETAVRILGRVPGLSVVAWAMSVQDALNRAELARPNVVVSEWRLPDGTAADLAAGLRERAPEAIVVVLTETWDDSLLLRAIDAGCAGCVAKHRPFEDLTAAIRLAAAGESLVAPNHLLRLLRRLRPQSPARTGELTEREREVLQLIAEGLSTQAIAARLGIAGNTVRNHSQRVIEKLGAHSRLEAVARGVRTGLVTR
jgi:putative two-component system response regulator